MTTITASISNILTNVITQIVQRCTLLLLVNPTCMTSAATINSLNSNLSSQLQALATSTANGSNLNSTTLSSLLSQLQTTIVSIWPNCITSIAGSNTTQRTASIVSCIQSNQQYQLVLTEITNFLNTATITPVVTTTPTAGTTPVGAPTTNQPHYQYPNGSTQPSGGYIAPQTNRPTGTQVPTNNQPHYPNGVIQQSGNPYTIPNQAPGYSYPVTTTQPTTSHSPTTGQPTGSVQLNGYIYNVPQSPYSKPIMTVTAGTTPGFVNVYYTDGTSAQVMQSSASIPVSNQTTNIIPSTARPQTSPSPNISVVPQYIPVPVLVPVRRHGHNHHGRYDQVDDNSNGNWLWLLLIIIAILLVLYFVFRSKKM